VGESQRGMGNSERSGGDRGSAVKESAVQHGEAARRCLVSDLKNTETLRPKLFFLDSAKKGEGEEKKEGESN